jgi:hypothetical protein
MLAFKASGLLGVFGMNFAQLSVVTAAIALGISSSASAATKFNFQFDNSGGGSDGTIGTPIVGSGTFISPIDLGVGQYALSSLAGFSLKFTFGSEVFSTSDIATPTDEVAVSITQLGSLERLVFTENGSTADGGPFGGSLDLVNSETDGLSFEPTAAGGHNLYQESGANGNLGNYLALSATVPEPATWAMMLGGFGGLGMVIRGSRRKPAAI